MILNKDRVIQATKNIIHNAKNYRVIFHHPEYLDGELYVVEYDIEKASNSCYVYVENGEANVLTSQALLNEMVARKTKKSGVASTLDSLGGMAGIIGLIVTLTIVYIVVGKPEAEIPQILSTALTAILGFYFGSKKSG
ncbi:hypothetical protein PSECIP111854_04175 [Pseudoalteromonas sp. CIP111854]|uniref:Uncharacterized protein n=1 Tax=Pseudoalteromonas holothuriae TaxID=2963714 RepID=A0A9W4VWE4_9GAMM|nr:hypothetical protein [Pseudoalteromonas sp. CIP111854]CAH9067697.1 hypothetical protein PSECIP111854_04175 [Pseudoalteromonas sp. CIP111854]